MKYLLLLLAGLLPDAFRNEFGDEVEEQIEVAAEVALFFVHACDDAVQPVQDAVEQPEAQTDQEHLIEDGDGRQQPDPHRRQ